MLRKLIKYDILADWKKYGLLFGAIIFLSITMLILDTSFKNIEEVTGGNVVAAALGASVGALFFGIIFATFVLIYVLALIRFYKNMIRDEGYLMHTLPVPTWKLLASKMITYYIWIAGAVITTLIAFFIASNPVNVIRFISEGGLAEILADAKENMGDFGFKLLGLIVMFVLLSPLSSMAECFFCFAVGNLSNSHKLLMSVLTYIGINVAMNIISSVASAILTFSRIDMFRIDPSANAMASYLTSAMGMALGFLIVITAGFLIAAERILSKKLNLE